jgi:hypothetical protein
MKNAMHRIKTERNLEISVTLDPGQHRYKFVPVISVFDSLFYFILFYFLAEPIGCFYVTLDYRMDLCVQGSTATFLLSKHLNQ